MECCRSSSIREVHEDKDGVGDDEDEDEDDDGDNTGGDDGGGNADIACSTAGRG